MSEKKDQIEQVTDEPKIEDKPKGNGKGKATKGSKGSKDEQASKVTTGAKRGRKGANDVVEMVADNRPVITPQLLDLRMDEVRDSVQRFRKGVNQHSFTLDLRNLQALNQIADDNGLDKSTVLDIAIDRFVDTPLSSFPFEALKDIQNDKRVTFKISNIMKERLDKYAKKETRQSAQFIVNLALQSLRDQMRAEKK